MQREALPFPASGTSSAGPAPPAPMRPQIWQDGKNPTGTRFGSIVTARSPKGILKVPSLSYHVFAVLRPEAPGDALIIELHGEAETGVEGSGVAEASPGKR